MTPGPHDAGWLPTATVALATLWAWLAAVVLHGLFWRSVRRPAPDPIRSSGPVDPSA
jgi:hypothetical protein